MFDRGAYPPPGRAWWVGWMRVPVLLLVGWLGLACFGVPFVAGMAPLAAWLLPLALPFDDTKQALRPALVILGVRFCAVGAAVLWTAQDFPGYLLNTWGRRLGPFKPDADEIGQQISVGTLVLVAIVEVGVAFYYWRVSRRPTISWDSNG